MGGELTFKETVQVVIAVAIVVGGMFLGAWVFKVVLGVFNA
jgi:hypothetical protein